MKAPRPHCRSRQGYTLVEAVIVVAIIGLLLAISIPNLPRWIDKWRIDGAARQAGLHIALAKLKAVSHRYPYTVTYVPAGGTYKSTVISRMPTLVISGTEGALDVNGNGTVGETEDPLQDRKLVLILPAKVTVDACPCTPPNAPPVTLTGNPGSSPLTFLTNGLAKMTNLNGAPMFALYFTNKSGDWKAVSVQHSGRIKIHTYSARRNVWLDD